MFPNRRYFPPPYPPRPQGGNAQPGKKTNLFSYYQTPDGGIDFKKIDGTAKQMKKLMDQVSPVLTKFLNGK
ncbi:YppG family protein [Bacillus pinisoli]|uniref:YppG family protein n=1 Tax=Bacillus pinisoli TaxID=2901866 RepID=UPI001FF109B9|nr:YppG family protein [Bacillus pinisoli]